MQGGTSSAGPAPVQGETSAAGTSQEETRAIAAPAPRAPTEEERDNHEVSHWPYRAWCKYCVQGRGKNLDHRQMDSELEHEVRTISIDYMYLGQDNESPHPILAMREHHTRWTESFIATCKGSSDIYNVLALSHCVRRTGIKSFIFKSDQEPAILDLKAKVVENLGSGYDIRPEASPVEEHASNGTIERAVWDVGGTARTLKCMIESNYQCKIGNTHNVLPWLIKYSGALYTLFCLGADGRTAYSRSRGKPWKRELPTFAECIMYLPTDRNRGHLNKLEARFRGPGVFLGVMMGTGELFVGTDAGVLTVFGFKRMPRPSRFDKIVLDKFVGVPWKMGPTMPRISGHDHQVEVNIEAAAPDDLPLAERSVADAVLKDPSAPRRVYIRREVELAKYGYSVRCPGCDAARGGLPTQTHSEECRARIQARMKADEDAKQRLVDAEQRRAQSSQTSQADPSGEVRPVQRASKRKGVLIDPIPDEVMTTDAGKMRDISNKRKSENDDIEIERDAGGPTSVPEAERNVGGPTNVPEAEVAGHPFSEPDQAPGMDLGLIDVWDAQFVKQQVVELNLLAAELGFPQVDISEVFNPGCFAEKASSYGLTPGYVFDITAKDELGEPWDFNLESKRVKCEAMVREQKPRLLVGSPTCKGFSQLLTLNASRMCKQLLAKIVDECMTHLRFVFRLYLIQHESGRWFLHEHPWGAWSWKVDFVVEMGLRPGVEVREGHQCPHNQYSYDIECWGLVLKRTGWMSNAPRVLDAVALRCSNETRPVIDWHRHVHLVDQRAQKAQVYPPILIKRVLKGLRDQLREAGDLNVLEQGVVCEEPSLDLHDDTWEEEADEFFDNISGAKLDGNSVRLGRAEELKIIDEMKVWEVVPIKACYDATGRRPISVRWVDINKGDENEPEIRCRLVARELKLYQLRDDVFSATPPMIMVLFLLSLAMTNIPWLPVGVILKMMFLDISRAHFHSPATRDVFVDLPPERALAGFCARLLKSMYGTRDAGANFQRFVIGVLETLDFIVGVFSPCSAHHKTRFIVLVYFGDDFVVLAEVENLLWFLEQLSRFLIVKNRGIMGPEPGDVKEIRLLNRMIRWGHDDDLDVDYIDWEPDPRHVEIILRQLGLSNSKGVTTPGVKRSKEELVNSPKVDATETKRFRSICMRTNYLAQDRLDIIHAAKEAARWMKEPTQVSFEMLKRIGRYLKYKPRVVRRFRQQQWPGRFTVKTDSDHAGCVITRRSTTCIVAKFGAHSLSFASNMQTVEALSSGESEFYGIVKGTAVGLGAASAAVDLGFKDLKVRVETDASAGKGIALRLGAGKVRHLETQYLWSQRIFYDKKAEVKKIPREENESDLGTRHNNANDIERGMRQAGFVTLDGKSNIALKAT